MSAFNTNHNYGSVTRVIHWGMALLVIAMIPLGLRANHLAHQIAETTMSIDGRQITFQVTGETDVAVSIKRMLTAHRPMLERETGWSVDVSLLPDGAALIIAASSEEQISQIMGHGFFGLKTIGAHHQQHHLMIASGHDPH